MDDQEKGRQGGEPEGLKDSAMPRKSANQDTSEVTVDQVFGELSDLPIFVPYVKQYNPKRGKFDKLPHCGRHGLSTADPDNWMTLPEALDIAREHGLSGVGIVMTGGVHLNGHTLVGIDADDVTPDFKLPFPTYRERSPSGKGIRAFVWVPTVALEGYKDTVIRPGGCDHVELYIGTAPRFLTLTFDAIDMVPIARLDSLAPWKLNKAYIEAAEAPALTGIGEPVDLAPLDLTDDQRSLLAGAGSGDDKTFDRSPVVHSLLLKLIDYKQPLENGKFKTFTQEDILATLLSEPAIWLYLCEHRNGNAEKAHKFANEELARAFKASVTGKLAALYGNPLWKVVDVEQDVKEEEPSDKPLCEALPDFLADGKPQVWLLEGILLKGQHNACMGHPGNGKTTGVLEMVLHVGYGLNLGNRQVVRDRIVYIAGEDPDGIRLRIKLWCQNHGVGFEDLRGWFYVIREPMLDDPEQVKRLLAELTVIKPGVLVIDTFSANYGGESEDKATEVKKWMQMIRRDFIKPFGCCVLTLHHPPKGSTNIHNWRGSGVGGGDIDNTFGFAKVGERIQMDNHGKRRGTNFDPIYWKIETAEIKGTLNNLGKPETSVMATLDGVPLIPDESLICMAIKVYTERGGKFTQRDIEAFSDISKSTVSRKLKEMKVMPGALVTERDKLLKLTKKGRETASFAVLAPGMQAKIQGVLGDPEGDPDE